MSAFLCSDRHTAALAFFLAKIELSSDAIATAMRLRDANNKAMAARYGDAPVPLGDIGRFKKVEYTPRQINTMARSFAYQCSEGNVMEAHPIAPMLKHLIEISGGEDMPGIQSFWSIE